MNKIFKNKLLILGPCSLESQEQMDQVTQVLGKIEVTYLRTQLFKPRTNPESFQGLGVEGLQILQKIKSQYPQFKFVCEVGSEKQLQIVAPHVHGIQIGARNMQNFELLKVIGKYLSTHHDFVILKRGFANNLEEWIMASKYLEKYGVPKEKIILCERGTRSFTSPTGVCLDFLMAKAAQNHGYKVIIDPSHGSKKSEFVLPLARASMAMDFDGLMIECHPEPSKSISDAAQALSLDVIKDFLS